MHNIYLYYIIETCVSLVLKNLQSLTNVWKTLIANYNIYTVYIYTTDN